MLQIRFHGRGGQGIKTASRILGTAAFLEGWHAQDFPVYGAERRGAAVAAYTRIDHCPILERGIISRPDYLLVGDETLLHDPTAGVLTGQETVTAVFVNSTHAADELKEELPATADVQPLDLTARMTEHLLSSNRSAGLGAIACGLVGIVSAKALEEAVREELASLSLETRTIDANVALALQVFAMTRPVAVHERRISPDRPESEHQPTSLHLPCFDAGPLGVPIIYAAGNSAARKTGAWRVVRPVIDLAACTRCQLCLAHCPEGVVSLNAHGYPEIDYDHCKGCLICAQECPLHCIHEAKEVRTW